MKIVLGLPKGSLEEATYALFKKAGWNIKAGGRSYFPSIDDEEISVILLRAQEISRYVEEGVLDAGLTGRDWIEENGSDVQEVIELCYAKSGSGRVRWVVAVPENSDIRSVKNLEGKRIATEAVNMTEKFLKKNGIRAEVEFSWGATEVKAPELVDAIVELTETGSSLRANNLRILETVMESTTRLIANKQAWQDEEKQRKIENLAVLLDAALNAESKVGIKLNVAKDNLEKILELLPSLRQPTVAQLAHSEWFAIDTVVDEDVVRKLVPKLRQAGAEGIIEYPLNKVIY